MLASTISCPLLVSVLRNIFLNYGFPPYNSSIMILIYIASKVCHWVCLKTRANLCEVSCNKFESANFSNNKTKNITKPSKKVKTRLKCAGTLNMPELGLLNSALYCILPYSSALLCVLSSPPGAAYPGPFDHLHPASFIICSPQH